MGKMAAKKESADITAFRTVVRERRGGSHYYVTLLGLRTFETLKLLERVKAGFSFRTFEHLQHNLALPADEVADLVQITKRTLARRRREGTLTSEESDRVLRASRMLGKALALFEGDIDAARAWLTTPAPALASRTPQQVASTELGAREVENLIGRLEHGVFS